MSSNRQAEEQSYVEAVGIVFEQGGLPRMAGRILGWLSISDSPHQTTHELAEALMASTGSISTMTRFLIQLGLIERMSLPGQRCDYFRIKLGASHRMLKDSLSQTTAFRQLMERGLGLTRGKAHANRQWLEEMRNMYAFFEKEVPAMLERWEKEREVSKLKAR